MSLSPFHLEVVNSASLPAAVNSESIRMAQWTECWHKASTARTNGTENKVTSTNIASEFEANPVSLINRSLFFKVCSHSGLICVSLCRCKSTGSWKTFKWACYKLATLRESRLAVRASRWGQVCENRIRKSKIDHRPIYLSLRSRLWLHGPWSVLQSCKDSRWLPKT